MVQKVTKLVAAVFAVSFSFAAYGLTVTPVWQSADSVLIFVGLLSFILLILFIYQRKEVPPDPRMALLWRNVPDIITEIDTEGTILTVNRTAKGFKESDLVGHSSFEFLSSEGQLVFSKALQDAINLREPQAYESELSNPDAETVWISNRIIPVIENLKITSLLIITSDISEQKLAHNSLLELKARAEQASLAKSQFLASMSHEIRTPMTGMLGMASILEQTELNVEQQECVSTIQQSAEHLLSIINDVLDLSKIEANKLSIENENFDLDGFVSSLVDMVGNKAQEKGLNLQTFIDDKVPRFIIADAVRLRQIMMNFLTNAIKFTMKGHVIIRIVPLQLKDSSVRLRLSVEDSGIGMSADQAAHIFDEYTHAHGQHSVQLGGSGLGLSICQRLAELMGGNIGVVSTPSVGSNFWLDIEVAISCYDNESYELAEKSKRERSIQGQTAWVLDEIKVNRLLMKEVARRTGFSVIEFNQLSQLLEKLVDEKSEKPDLLVFSRELGTKKIDQLLAYMNSINSNVFLAMTTVEAINNEYETLIEQGVHAFWEWPLGQKELESLLDRLFTHDWNKHPNTVITRYKRTLVASDEQPDCRGKILLAEDNLVNQKVAVQMLKKMGYEVDVAFDGEEALAAWKRDNYDVILMDCHMPVMDGVQATRMIRMQEEGEHIPILALTADVMAERKSECIKSGMDDFMSKPIRMDELRRVLSNYVKKS
jgi:PAS domain S-box-containing protein